MSSRPSPHFTEFSEMLRYALGSTLSADTSSFISMLAEDAVMEFPFAARGNIQRLEGRDEITAYLTKIGPLLAFDTLYDVVANKSAEGETVFLQFKCDGYAKKTGRPYRQSYISVIHLKNGKIVLYQDYWNPLIIADALGEEPALRANL